MSLFFRPDTPPKTWLAPPGLISWIPEESAPGCWDRQQSYYLQPWTPEIARTWANELITTPASMIYVVIAFCDMDQRRYKIRDAQKEIPRICCNLYPPVEASDRPLFNYTKLWTQRRYANLITSEGLEIFNDFTPRYAYLAAFDLVFPTPSKWQDQDDIDDIFELLANYDLLTNLIQYSEEDLPGRVIGMEYVIQKHRPLLQIQRNCWIPFKKQFFKPESPLKRSKYNPEETHKKHMVFDLVCFWILRQPFSTAHTIFLCDDDYLAPEYEYISQYIPWSMICRYMSFHMLDLAVKDWINPLQLYGFSQLLKYNFWKEQPDMTLEMPFIGTLEFYAMIPISKNIFAVDVQSFFKRASLERLHLVDDYINDPSLSKITLAQYENMSQIPCEGGVHRCGFLNCSHCTLSD
ncbi:hypothetical protein [Crucivirus-536]|nr:hypothetical protein [Crucivirus-536]